MNTGTIYRTTDSIQLVGSHCELTNINITNRLQIKFPETFRNYDRD